MIIPDNADDKAKFVAWVVRLCMSSAGDRRKLYEKRFRYYMFGQNGEEKVRFNRLKSHVQLVSSFLYLPDSVAWDIAAPRNADAADIARFQALEDDWAEQFRDCGLADAFGDAVLWSIVLECMIIKQGWNDETDSVFAHLVDPGSFGVFHEENFDFASQPAICHSYILDYDDACERLTRAGLRNKIESMTSASEGDSDHGLPSVFTQLMITSSTGKDVTHNVTGTINPDYTPSPTYQARIERDAVQFFETWIWDNKAKDYRIFHSTGPDILVSDSLLTIDAIKKAAPAKIKANYASATNFFLARENPFTPVRTFGLYRYFWGDCHLEDLIPLQEWSNERLDQIDTILRKQVRPPKVFSGFMGLEDEVAATLGGENSWVADAMPSAKVEELKPEMPGDLFAEFNEIGNLFMEQSGLTEGISGRGGKNVRSGKQQRELNITGGGRIRKAAIELERSLVRAGDIGLRLYAKNSDEKILTDTAEPFVPAQIIDQTWSMSVSGHSHSPLFTMETTEKVGLLAKFRAIDRARMIRLLRPPGMSNILHELRKQEAAELVAAQHAPPAPKRGAAKG